jgi:hypothetical protein
VDDDGIQENAKAHFSLNLGSILSLVKLDHIDKKEVPYFVAECIMHEVIHSLESWAGVEFDEDQVDSLIEKYDQWHKESCQK